MTTEGQLEILHIKRKEYLKLMSEMNMSLIIEEKHISSPDEKNYDLFRTFSGHEAAVTDLNLFVPKENLTPQSIIILEYFKHILEFRSVIDQL